MHVTTEEELRTLPHIEVTSRPEWNPKIVKLGRVSIDNDSNAFNTQEHTFGYHTMDTGDYLYLANGTYEALLRSINMALVKMGAKLKQNISEIITPAADEIPTKRTFIPNTMPFKASAELIEDLWCIVLNKSQVMLGTTTQKGVRSFILLLAQRYIAYRVFSMRRHNARFAKDTFFRTLNH